MGGTKANDKPSTRASHLKAGLSVYVWPCPVSTVLQWCAFHTAHRVVILGVRSWCVNVRHSRQESGEFSRLSPRLPHNPLDSVTSSAIIALVWVDERGGWGFPVSYLSALCCRTSLPNGEGLRTPGLVNEYSVGLRES
jgi:hypothetical protein